MNDYNIQHYKENANHILKIPQFIFILLIVKVNAQAKKNGCAFSLTKARCAFSLTEKEENFTILTCYDNFPR